MSYLVIARKYRPSLFSDLVGQDAVVTTLKNAISSDRVAHAYLFAGPRGVGKTSMARILSMALNCSKGVLGEPCGACDICKSISNGNDVDVLEIDGASNRGIDEIRNIRQNVSYAPSRSKYKIYIIDEVHMLTKEAFNALLKTLEEPPPHVKFIFATTSADKLPETVQSRCQRFNFKEISSEVIEKQIALICKKENIDADEKVFRYIAKYARGGLRDALSVLDQIISFANGKITVSDVHSVLGTIDEENLFSLIDNVLKHNVNGSLRDLWDVFDGGKGVTEFIDQTIWYLRDLLIALIINKGKDGGGDNISEYQGKLLESNAEISADMLIYMIQVLADVHRKSKDDRHKRILLEVAIIKLAETEGLLRISELLGMVEALERKLSLISSGREAADRKDSIDRVVCRDESKDDQDKTVCVTDRNISYSKPQDENGSNEVAVEELPVNSDENSSNEVTIENLPVNSEISNSNGNGANLDAGSLWSKILNKIPPRKKSLWAILQEGRCIDYNNNQVTVEFPKEFTIHKERIERPAERGLIEQIAEEIAGKKIKLKIVLSDNLKKKDDNPVKICKSVQVQVEEDKVPDSGQVTCDDVPVNDKDIMNNNFIKNAIKIFDGRIVDVRRIGK